MNDIIDGNVVLDLCFLTGLMKGRQNSFSKLLQGNKESAVNVLILFVLVQVIAVVASSISPQEFRYLSPTNLFVQLRAIPVLDVIALGVGVLMIAGEFDLSVGSTYTLTGIAMATMGEVLSKSKKLKKS